MLVMLVATVFAEHQNREIFEQSQRTEVVNKAALVRARIEGTVAANIQLVHGMVSAISTEPGMDHTRFSELARHLFTQHSQLRNIAAAPQMVVQFVYPVAGNENVFGINHSPPSGVHNAATQARDTRQTVLTEPVSLIQGGNGIIGRMPVYYLDRTGREVFWGIVSAVIDADQVYAASGLTGSGNDLAFAMASMISEAEAGTVFFGDPAIATDNPVAMDVLLPSGRWRLYAIPSGGWATDPPNTMQLRLILVIAVGLMLLPTILAGRLNAEKRHRIAEQQRREHELLSLSRRLELALAASQVGVWELNTVTGHFVWDDRMNELFGLPIDGGPREYTQWRDILHPDDAQRAEYDLQDAIGTSKRYSSTFRIRMPSGKVRHIRAMGAVYHDGGSAARVAGVSWDVTADTQLNEALLRAKTQAEAKNFELETAKARMEHNALHDPLTGLPNRRYLDDVLRMHTARSARIGGTASILHIDLDRFKQINDTLGHAAGDAMLVHAAEILKAAVRQSDFVARIGGDEFVILCLDEVPPAELRVLSERIIEAMRRPVSYHGHECRFGVSIGVASGDGRQVPPKQLLVNADIALYRAKRQGRNRYEFFSEDLQAEIVTAKRLADDLLNALDNNEFVAYFQPQFDARTLNIVGVEALARWVHPFRGIVTPDTFMATAEDLSVLAEIDRMILEQSLDCLTALEAAGLARPRISVNVSAKRLREETLIETLRGLNIEPGTISFEIMESNVIDENDSMARWNIDQIRDLGIDIEIDDFGTGYASIVGLLQLRPTRLKIDHRLIGPITGSARQQSLVRSIVDIGASLGISVVAEGVETLEHARLLREMGCSTLQGFAFARPMRADELAQFIRSEAWKAAS